MRKLSKWEKNLARKATFKESFELLGVGFGSLFIQVMFLFQIGAGGLRTIVFANTIVDVLIFSIALSIILLVVYPKAYFSFAKLLLHFIGKYTINQIANLSFLLIYLLTMPIAALFGKKKYISVRPEHKSWLNQSSNWKVNTWVAKENLDPKLRKQKTVVRLLGMFIAQRNWFLLIVTTILIIVGMIILFAQSSAIAPFIYTLF